MQLSVGKRQISFDFLSPGDHQLSTKSTSVPELCSTLDNILPYLLTTAPPTLNLMTATTDISTLHPCVQAEEETTPTKVGSSRGCTSSTNKSHHICRKSLQWPVSGNTVTVLVAVLYGWCHGLMGPMKWTILIWSRNLPKAVSFSLSHWPHETHKEGTPWGISEV